MFSIVQCPQCPNKVKVPANAGKATCPVCHHRFSTAPASESESDWVISPWALVAIGSVIAGLLSASLIGVRLLTQLLAAVSLLAALFGFIATKSQSSKDKLWLLLGAGGGGLLLLLALLAPGTLNQKWTMDIAVHQPSPDQQAAVPRDTPLEPGKPLTSDEWVDAAQEVIRQKDLLLSVESFKTAPMPDKGQTDFAQVHLRFTNLGGGRISFQGFEEHPPVLHDSADAPCAFLEQRKRMVVGGDPVFGNPKLEGSVVPAQMKGEYLLVFELPRAGSKNLKLTIPAQAWGRKGTFQFQISDSFEANFPISKN